MTTTLTPRQISDIRGQFDILSRHVYDKPLIYFDNAASSQTPRRVIDTLSDMYRTHHANVHRGVHSLSREATDIAEATRHRVAAAINAPVGAGYSPWQQIIFTRGTTEAINLVATSYCSRLDPGDEIVLTVMEHHSNIVPWQMAAARHGLVIKACGILPDGSLDMDMMARLITPRTRVVGVCHVSNVLGTVNPVAEIAAMAHRAGAICLVDGAQAAPHMHIDVDSIGADFYVFSSHKMYGPTGIGVLYGRYDLLNDMPPYQGGGEMIEHVSFEGTTYAALPFKFEAGTPDYSGTAAFASAYDFIDSCGIDAMAAHEHYLTGLCTSLMRERVPQATIYGTAPGKGPVISFNIAGAHHYDVGMLLDRLGIAVRTGHHCAQPLMQVLGVPGTVRASFAVYNTADEVHAFVAALERVTAMLT